MLRGKLLLEALVGVGACPRSELLQTDSLCVLRFDVIYVLMFFYISFMRILFFTRVCMCFWKDSVSLAVEKEGSLFGFSFSAAVFAFSVTGSVVLTTGAAFSFFAAF